MSNFSNNLEQRRLDALKSLHEKAQLTIKKNQNQHSSFQRNIPHNVVLTNKNQNNNAIRKNGYSSNYDNNPYRLYNTPNPQSQVVNHQSSFSGAYQNENNQNSASAFHPTNNANDASSSNIVPALTESASSALNNTSDALGSNAKSDISTIKHKDVKTAITDLLSLGYNYYDLIVLAGVSKQFLDDLFPEIKFDPKPKEPVSSTIHNPSFSNISPAQSFATLNRAASLTPQPPSNSPSTQYVVPTVNNSQNNLAKHIQKKLKFGSNRWEKTLNIVLSDSEDSSCDESELAAKRKMISNTQDDSSKIAINEQIRLLREQINKAEKERFRPSPQVLSSSVPSTATQSKSQSPAIISTPGGDDNAKSKSLEPQLQPISLATVSSNPALLDSSNSNSWLAVKAKLAEAHQTLHAYEKDKNDILMEKEKFQTQLKDIQMDKYEEELKALKNLLEVKIKQHIERRTEASIIKANLEAVSIREKVVEDSIEETKKQIMLLDMEELVGRPSSVDGSSSSNENTETLNTDVLQKENEPRNECQKPENERFLIKNTRNTAASFFSENNTENNSQCSPTLEPVSTNVIDSDSDSDIECLGVEPKVTPESLIKTGKKI